MNSGLQRVAFIFLAAIVAAFLFAGSNGVKATMQDDPAALYKTKCVACHGATSEKKFDATKPDEELIQTLLKGKKMEKPPNMPAFEEKGITADQAKALVTFMKSQKH